MKLEMIQYQNEITGLKFKIDNMINERSSMNIEMQHLRDRERNLMDELMFKD
jgi:regulator of replication initiation timing